MTNKITRNVLNTVETVLLAQIVRERYAESRLDNAAFAKRVNEEYEHKFRLLITPAHIAGMLTAFGIPSNYSRVVRAAPVDVHHLTSRVAELEESVGVLRATVKELRASVFGFATDINSGNPLYKLAP